MSTWLLHVGCVKRDVELVCGVILTVFYSIRRRLQDLRFWVERRINLVSVLLRNTSLESWTSRVLRIHSEWSHGLVVCDLVTQERVVCNLAVGKSISNDFSLCFLFVENVSIGFHSIIRCTHKIQFGVWSFSFWR